jgi:hypothetical protein
MFLSKTSLSLIVVSSMVSQSIQQDFPDWQAPGEGDVRSPCPFINTLANHGLINRNGKDVDLYEMVNTLSITFDGAPPLFQFLADLAVSLNFTSTDEDGVVRMDIDQLFAHNKMEHDASFFRADHFFGEEESMLVDTGLLDSLLSVNPDSDVLTFDDLATFQYNRIIDSRMNNREVNVNEGQGTSFSAQATLFLVLGQDPDLAFVQKDRLDELIRFERLPEGFVNGTVEPSDVLAEGTLAADIRLQFLENFEAALAAELPEATDPPAMPEATDPPAMPEATDPPAMTDTGSSGAPTLMTKSAVALALAAACAWM